MFLRRHQFYRNPITLSVNSFMSMNMMILLPQSGLVKESRFVIVKYSYVPCPLMASCSFSQAEITFGFDVKLGLTQLKVPFNFYSWKEITAYGIETA